MDTIKKCGAGKVFRECLWLYGSATDLVSVTLLRGEEGVHLMLANLPGVSYESAPRQFRETRITVANWENFLTGLFSHAVQ